LLRAKLKTKCSKRDRRSQHARSPAKIGNAGALDRQAIAVHTFGMTLPRDRLPYSSPFTRPPLKLPGNARMIVWSVVNIEEWEITRADGAAIVAAATAGSGRAAARRSTRWIT
jgi:hypothetical protein